MTADHHVHPVVMFVGRHCIYELERETYTYFICIPLPVFTLFIEAFSAFTLFIDAPLSGSVQKAVVISLPRRLPSLSKAIPGITATSMSS